MMGRERIDRILRREAVDRIGLYEHFWGDTQKAWSEAGKITMNENMSDHFGFDMEEGWAFNFTADLDWKDEVVEETEETRLVRDGNGALLRRHKTHDTTPEHVDFRVKTREDWEKWDKAITDNLNRIQNNDGSWTGHHCITGRTFCTSAALMVLMVDRTPKPVSEEFKKR